MNKKIASAFVGLMFVMIICFAPTTNAQWPPLPNHQTERYIVVGGEAMACNQLYLGGLPLPPFEWDVPFARPLKYYTPMVMWEDITFSIPHPAAPVVFLTVPWTSIKSIDHVIWSSTLGYTRIQLLPIPTKDGMGWLYTANGVSDVDIYVINTNVGGTPVSVWTGPSRLAGQPASDPNWGGFPGPGVDNLPGFLLSPGGQDDGFGDGQPDPAGSSVLFLPLQLSVSAWNGTDWEFQFGGPFLEPLTTGVAFDQAVAPGSWINGKSIMMQGHPWENLATVGGWSIGVPLENIVKKWVKYVCAWSFIQYQLAPGVTLDLVYGASEYKVKEEHVIPDINGDLTVTIGDLRIASKSYDLYDEGIPAYPGYKKPWWWDEQTTTIDPETGLAYGPYPPAWVAVFGCPKTVFADPDFDARADMNNDGHIDIFDLRLIAKHYLATIDP